jgi:hypothetical protein
MQPNKDRNKQMVIFRIFGTPTSTMVPNFHSNVEGSTRRLTAQKQNPRHIDDVPGAFWVLGSAMA